MQCGICLGKKIYRMHRYCSIFFCLFLNAAVYVSAVSAQSEEKTILTVKKTDDFTITGEGEAEPWEKAQWIELRQLTEWDTGETYLTRAKILYSDTGLYFLFQCEDEVLNASMRSDYSLLWQEDVVEVFLWPDDRIPFYFEYELSPLNYELPILVHEQNGHKTRWRPFDYGFKQQTRHRTQVEGKAESGAKIVRWFAEFFIPFEYLQPLNGVPPEPGDRWRANLYRIDYDRGETHFAWQPIEKSFHEYEKFGTLIFE